MKIIYADQRESRARRLEDDPGFLKKKNPSRVIRNILALSRNGSWGMRGRGRWKRYVVKGVRHELEKRCPWPTDSRRQVSLLCHTTISARIDGKRIIALCDRGRVRFVRINIGLFSFLLLLLPLPPLPLLLFHFSPPTSSKSVARYVTLSRNLNRLMTVSSFTTDCEPFFPF